MPKTKLRRRRKVKINSARLLTGWGVGHDPDFFDSELHSVVMGVMFGDDPEQVDGKGPFDAGAYEDCAEGIQSAVADIMAAHGEFTSAIDSNRQRLTRDEQVEDLENLWNCLLEAHERLFPWSLPPDAKPLMREKYSPVAGGKDTFDEEIRNLALRLGNLVTIIDSIELPYKKGGRKEQSELDEFLTALDQIFEDRFGGRFESYEPYWDDSETDGELIQRSQFKKRFFAAICEYYQVKLPVRWERNIERSEKRHKNITR